MRGANLDLGTGRVTARGATARDGSGMTNLAGPGYIVIQASGTVTGTSDPPARRL